MGAFRSFGDLLSKKAASIIRSFSVGDTVTIESFASVVKDTDLKLSFIEGTFGAFVKVVLQIQDSSYKLFSQVNWTNKDGTPDRRGQKTLGHLVKQALGDNSFAMLDSEIKQVLKIDNEGDLGVTHKELQQLCKSRSLSAAGRSDILVDRIYLSMVNEILTTTDVQTPFEVTLRWKHLSGDQNQYTNWNIWVNCEETPLEEKTRQKWIVADQKRNGSEDIPSEDSNTEASDFPQA